MPIDRPCPHLLFVFPPRAANEDVVASCRLAGVGAVFDLSGDDHHRLAPGLRRAEALQVRLSLAQFMDPELGRFLVRSGVDTVWVDFLAPLHQAQGDEFLAQLRQWSDVVDCRPVVDDEATRRWLAENVAPLRCLGLRGSEAAGWNGDEPVAMLLSHWEAAGGGSRPGVALWGGVATAEAAAAFLASGAQSVIFESLHALTSLAGSSEAARRRLERMRLDHTGLVGGELGLSCRVWDRGNSPETRRLRGQAAALAAGLSHEEDPAPARREFVRLADSAMKGGDGGESKDGGLIPLGPEAAFARGFAARFGADTGPALAAFRQKVDRLWAQAPATAACWEDSPTARELGTAHPFIQGAMSWISDQPGFAMAVAQAGGLPTLALGLRGAAELARELGGLSEAMAGRPYAVNLLALPENPHLAEQIAWVKQARPPLVVVAAGDPALVAELTGAGLKTAYIAPDEDLLRLALEHGAAYVILEGNEAGGHVGAHSTLTLAQMALELRRARPELFARARVVLAGGVASRPSAWRAARLGAEAVQMGTAYLATREIVATGALSPLYQRLILEALPGATTVSGRAAGLGVRSLVTPVIRRVEALERELAAGGLDEMEFRRRLEGLCAGSLLVAARGVAAPGGAALRPEECRQKGQFMSGTVAGDLARATSLAELHESLAAGPLELAAPSAAEPRLSHHRPLPRRAQDGVVITGMAMANSLGHSRQEVWEAALALRSGVTDVPLARFDMAELYHPTPGRLGSTYCRVGAFMDLNITRRELGVPPTDFNSMSFSTRFTLWLAQKALAESGLLESSHDPSRVAVVIAQNSGEAGSTLGDLVVTGQSGRILHDVDGALGLSPAQRQAVWQAIRLGRKTVDDATLVGRLNSAAAGFICNQYGLQGPSFAVTAACSSSLVALYLASQMVRAGVVDAAVVGGGEEQIPPMMYLEFSALMALAGASGHARPPREWSRPFDADRDGMVPGEGGAMVIMEREPAARARGARILARLAGMGASNSCQGMVEPLAADQALAMRAALASAGWSPGAVDLVECHATSTVLGDVEEVRAIREVHGAGSGINLTAFKSQIGHNLGASGLSNLVHGVMAMQAGVLPPTINYDTPDPAVRLAEQGLRLCARPEEWPAPQGRPRRLQVDAFGFGGANYVALVEQGETGGHGAAHSRRRQEPATPEVMPGLFFYRAQLPAGAYRLAVEAPSRMLARGRLTGRLALLTAPELGARELRGLARHGIHLAPAGQAPPAMALIFTGQGSHYPGMGGELYRRLPAVRRRMDQLAALADYPLLELMFDTESSQLQRTLWQQPALYALESAVAGWLLELGLKPRALAGHSLGELTAMSLAGVFSPEAGLGLVNQRAVCMDQVSQGGPDPGAMLATDAPLAELEEMVAAGEGLFFTNYNSPRQTVVGGSEPAVEALRAALEDAGHWCARLKVSMAFHSPAMRIIREPMARYLEGMEFSAPALPVISNNTGRPFPADAGRIKAMVLNHLETPVQWVDELCHLWDEQGIRLFLEVGPRDTLCGMVADTLEGAACLPTCHPDGEVAALRRAMARLYTWGLLPPWDEEMELDLTETLPIRAEVEDQGMAPAALPDSTPIPAGVPAPKPVAAPDAPAPGDTLEAVVSIIMRATGYERDEIEPDMDLRQDLAMRSSRLPVIMDAAEKTFGIKIHLHEFLDVRTVRELALRVEQVAQRQGGSPGQALPGDDPLGPAAKPMPAATDGADTSAPPLRRLLLTDHLLEGQPGPSWRLEPSAPVFMLAAPGSALAEEAAEALRAWSGGEMRRLGLPANGGADEVNSLLASLQEGPPPAGLVIVLDGGGAGEALFPAGPDEAAACLEGLFAVLKSFAASPAKAFCLALHRGPHAGDGAAVAAEGLAGVLLAMSLEHPGLGLRCLSLGQESRLSEALPWALDASNATVRLTCRQGKARAPQAAERPLSLGGHSSLAPRPGEVVVVSGGARGITAHLSRALALMGCRLVLLGQRELDPAVDWEALAAAASNAPPENADLAAGVEINRNLAELRRLGAEPVYAACDVRDAEQVARALERALGPDQPVAGLVNGAGVLADAFMQMMPPQDFARVLEVKLKGAWNLYQALRGRGLRFLAGISSLAAVTGNLGQANYCAANRAQAALLRGLARADGLATKVLWLPPVSGAGMADDAETRELLEARGMSQAYLGVGELAELWARELALGPEDEDWVLPARLLPASPNLLLSLHEDEGEAPPDCPVSVAFAPSDLPMVDTVEELDLQAGSLQARRRISLERDLWLGDHRPLGTESEAVVSAIMIVEAMLEGCRLLLPHLEPHGVAGLELRDFIPCPDNGDNWLGITARRQTTGPGQVTCAVQLSSPDAGEASGEADDQGAWPVRAMGQAMAGPGPGRPERLLGSEDLADLAPVTGGPEEITRVYAERPGMGPRYQVLSGHTAVGLRSVRAHTVHRPGEDVAGLGPARYQYPAYLLESLLHAVNFHHQAQAANSSDKLLPLGLAELRFHGQPHEDEELVVEACLRESTAQGQQWDGQVLSANGAVVLSAKGLRFFVITLREAEQA